MRPNARTDAILERNESSLVRARDRQAQLAAADADLAVAMRDFDRAARNVEAARRRVVKLHHVDEILCRRLRHENVLLHTRKVKAVSR